MTPPTDVVILADHSLLLALPAFLPAVAVAGVVTWIAVRDRRRGDDDDESDGSGSNAADSSRQDGAP